MPVTEAVLLKRISTPPWGDPKARHIVSYDEFTKTGGYQALEKALGMEPKALVDIANANEISPYLLEAVVWQESRWNPSARSRVGAIGLAQLMPGTARDLGVDPSDPIQNLSGGARYLRQQLDEFGSVRLALAAYNAGPGRVRRLGRVPRIPETLNYVATIETDLTRLGRGPSSGLFVSEASTQARSAVLLSASFDEAPAPEAAAVEPPVPAPPSWDVFARFRWEREHGSKERSVDE